jgi:hypothetical protein
MVWIITTILGDGPGVWFYTFSSTLNNCGHIVVASYTGMIKKRLGSATEKTFCSRFR